MICDILSGFCNNKLDISCLKQIAHKWLPSKGKSQGLSIHVSEPFLLVNILYQPFGNALSIKTSSKCDLIKLTMFLSFVKPLKITHTCIYVWI